MTRRLIPRVVHRELIASKEADVRCGDDNAIVAKPGKLALKAVPVWTGLVAEKQLAAPTGELLANFQNSCRFIADLAEVADLTVPAILHHGNCNAIFVVDQVL